MGFQQVLMPKFVKAEQLEKMELLKLEGLKELQSERQLVQQ